MATGISEKVWAVILAAGDGRRLLRLTQAIHGCGVPKQFAVLGGTASLLQDTLDRIKSVSAIGGTLVVVDERHKTIARRQLRQHPEAEIILQPRNLGLGPGILLPLARLLARDARGIVAIFPSDHRIPYPEPFYRALDDAIRFARDDPDRVTLLGAVPDYAETDYGWIVPGERLGAGSANPAFSVRRFVEKPSQADADRLLRQRALWNTLIAVGQFGAFWSTARKCIPGHTELFAHAVQHLVRPKAGEFLRALYACMEPVDLGQPVWERSGNLAVIPVAGSGWIDVGAPQRVVRDLVTQPPRASASEPVFRRSSRTPAHIPTP